MNTTVWFDDLPVIGKLPPEQAIVKLREVGEDDVADMLEMTQEAETKAFRSSDVRSWLHLQDRPWEHTAHAFGYLAPASPGNAPLPIRSIGTVAAEAEGWYKRGLELYEQTNSGGPESAKTLNNLAALLVD